MTIRERIRAWRRDREWSEAERLNRIFNRGFAEGYDEGFLKAIAEPDVDEYTRPQNDE